MLPNLRRLALAIDAEWKAAGFRTRAFPQIAARAIERFEAHRRFDLNAVGEWVLHSRSYPAECNPFGPLGPPAFTVWSNSRFFVNVYAYTTPELVIHDHNFAGAFVNVAGRSIHCMFRFGNCERIDGSVSVGAVDLAKTEVIGEGEVRQIEPGAAFIHQVWHISQPTVVLVIRTPPLPRRNVRQFEYFRPAVATEIVRDENLTVSSTQRFRYTRKMLQCLRASGAGVPYLMRLVERERPWAAIWHLVENWQFLTASDALEEVIRRGTKRHGSWFTAMTSVAARAGVFYGIEWRRVAVEQDRIVLALLLTLGSWTNIAAALQSLVHERVPEVAVLESLRRLSEQHAIPLALSEDRLAMLLCILRSRGDRRIWNALVRDTFELDGRRGWSEVRQVDRELREHELLKPLFHYDS